MRTHFIRKKKKGKRKKAEEKGGIRRFHGWTQIIL
jgi:hypothetical protein